ncbi:thiol reductase thioredoxin [Geodermatophilus sp. TF02-6]|uniref:thioredoxin family protein n=1 Tax=Geodermatophilus sp. TF02-6 TaxID=2250575 RepID=UPI000DEB6F10|nr:thioredoxin family protein [Geodermatophilus sp. TF02-6]RBY82863.1 thiol reductase thioredoxin [Geodermatophilus sp. TF02-6]
MQTVSLTEDDFAATVDAGGIVLVDFRTARSGSSRAFAAVFDAAAHRHSDLVFAAVDTEAEPGLAAAVGVRRSPTLMVFRDGVPVFAEPGWLPADSVDLLIATVRELDMTAVREQYPGPV